VGRQRQVDSDETEETVWMIEWIELRITGQGWRTMNERKERGNDQIIHQHEVAQHEMVSGQRIHEKYPRVEWQGFATYSEPEGAQESSKAWQHRLDPRHDR
jgi:hypothetical protein